VKQIPGLNPPNFAIAKAGPCLFHGRDATPAARMPESTAAPPDAPASRPASSSKARTFLQRSASTVVLVALITLAFWLSQPWILFGLFALLSLGALAEFFHLFSDLGFRRFRLNAFLVAIVYLALTFSPHWGYELSWQGELDGLALAALMILMVLFRVRSPLEGFRSLDEIAATLLGFTYCVLLFSFVPKIFLLPVTTASGLPASTYYLIHLVTVTKMTDAGAYLVGSAIGRQKLVPHISPGKTWQGFWGSLVFAIGGSYLAWWLLGDRIPLVGPVGAGVLGLSLALVAVLGDLAESIMKRSLEVKDSGHVMPGIGGVLDLIDSIIFTAPVYYLYLRLVS
jgi:phosphatidate cytidylyltransferase